MEFLVLFFVGQELVETGFYEKNLSAEELESVISGKGVSYKIVKLSCGTSDKVKAFWKFNQEIGSDFAVNLLNGLARDIVSGVLFPQQV